MRGIPGGARGAPVVYPWWYMCTVVHTHGGGPYTHTGFLASRLGQKGPLLAKMASLAKIAEIGHIWPYRLLYLAIFGVFGQMCENHQNV